MKTPHKHAELIKAWADGAEIEVKLLRTNRWEETSDPSWNYEYEYRIKPEPKPDVTYYCKMEMYGFDAFSVHHSTTDNLKLTFSGETGKLIKAEVIA